MSLSIVPEQSGLFSLGFSFKSVFLIWAITGGFLRSKIHFILWTNFCNSICICSHFLLCNFLSVMLKPLYEAPINSPQDIIEKDHTLFGNVGKNEKIHFFTFIL